MPYPASLVAYAFVKKGLEEGKPVTQMKLQKIVYFAHGYHLAKYGDPLINEEFEAWKFGPVVPDIYQNYKLYGSEPIFNTSLITDQERHEADLLQLDPKALDAINYTWEATKNVSASHLSAWSHNAGSPWYDAYTSSFISNPIKNTTIKQYFSELLTANE